MVPPPRAFRLVWRAFDSFEFDDAKNEELVAYRGFDFYYASTLFPGYVLERVDTRFRRETRYQVIGEVFDDILMLAYTLRHDNCRLITAWRAGPLERDFGMTTRGKSRIVQFTAAERPAGYFNRERFENPLPDSEERPVVTPEDIEATRQELRELRRRMTPKSA